MNFPAGFCFESYGVKVRFEVENEELGRLARAEAERALLKRLRYFDNQNGEIDHTFRVYSDAEGGYVFEDEGLPDRKVRDRTELAAALNMMIRIQVGSKSRKWVFVHSGVVAWKGKAIVIPGKSYNGKTTLVAELIRNGATYFSDEYAVFDTEGLVHPFERDLSVRDGEDRKIADVPATEFGAASGDRAVPVGMLLLTKYEPDAEWRPEMATIGEGILETVPNVLPVRFNTEFSLKVLNAAFSRAIIVRSSRGEARVAAPQILAFLEDNLNFTHTE